MTSLRKLRALYENKMLDVKQDENSEKFKVAGELLTEAQLERMLTDIGWMEHAVSTDEAVGITKSYMNAFKKSMTNEDFWNNLELTFQNKKDSEYGRTFDRVVIKYPRKFSYTLIKGMKSAGGAYVLYNTGDATCIKKCRTMKQVIEYIETQRGGN